MPRYIVQRTFPDDVRIPVNADGAGPPIVTSYRSTSSPGFACSTRTATRKPAGRKEPGRHRLFTPEGNGLRAGGCRLPGLSVPAQLTQSLTQRKGAA
jgi:hypothetical protein